MISDLVQKSKEGHIHNLFHENAMKTVELSFKSCESACVLLLILGYGHFDYSKNGQIQH